MSPRQPQSKPIKRGKAQRGRPRQGFSVEGSLNDEIFRDFKGQKTLGKSPWGGGKVRAEASFVNKQCGGGGAWEEGAPPVPPELGQGDRFIKKD